MRDELVEAVIAAFNGGLVRVEDDTNPRGYITYYRPKEAMRAALAVAEPAIRADERERCAKVADAKADSLERALADVLSRPNGLSVVDVTEFRARVEAIRNTAAAIRAGQGERG